MATPIAMPRQGQSVESCVILEWFKKKGEKVEQGENLFSYETDKASFEFESPVAGTLLDTFFDADADVEVLTNVAVIGEPGESVEEFRPGASDQAQPDAQSPKQPQQASPETPAGPRPEAAPVVAEQRTDAGAKTAAISPRARNLAQRTGVDTNRAEGTGPHGRIIERDIQRMVAQGASMTPTARAKAAAQSLSAPAEGTGIGGRIRASDLVREAAGAAPVAQIAADVADEVTEVKLSNMRKIIGDRMVQSLREAAQLTLHGSADASGLLAYRARVKKSGESLGLANITITDLVVFAVTRLLPRFPEINALYKDGSVFQHKHAHCALAVDTPRGLMVPVIRYADRLSLNDLAIEAKQLAAQCIEGSINPDFLSGGTLTISNLGSFGVEYFTPVLNPPQVALLGVNAITSRPVAGADGAVVMKPHIGLSLTIDHRAVDGAPGARFLKAVVEALENIQLTLSL